MRTAWGLRQMSSTHYALVNAEVGVWPLNWETALLETREYETEVEHPTVQLNPEIKAMCSGTVVLNLNDVEEHVEHLMTSTVIFKKKKKKKKKGKERTTL